MSAPAGAYKVHRREGEWTMLEHAGCRQRVDGGAVLRGGAGGGAFVFAGARADAPGAGAVRAGAVRGRACRRACSPAALLLGCALGALRFPHGGDRPAPARRLRASSFWARCVFDRAAARHAWTRGRCARCLPGWGRCCRGWRRRGWSRIRRFWRFCPPAWRCSAPRPCASVLLLAARRARGRGRARLRGAARLRAAHGALRPLAAGGLSAFLSVDAGGGARLTGRGGGAGGAVACARCSPAAARW